MSAGSGVVHSEFNPSTDKPVHFMQIWIQPREKGLEPRYADQPIIGSVDNEWNLILSPDGRDGSMAIRQDVELRTVSLTEGETLAKGDSLALSEVGEIDLVQSGGSVTKVMLFDLPLV